MLLPSGERVLIDREDAVLANLRWHRVPGRRTDYAARSDGGVRVYLHREILGLVRGDPRQGDHINGNGLDNRRANLRIVTAAEQRQNTTARRDKKGCPYRGVFLNKRTGRWYGQAQVAGKKHSTPHFTSAEEAHSAVTALRARVMPMATAPGHTLRGYESPPKENP